MNTNAHLDVRQASHSISSFGGGKGSTLVFAQVPAGTGPVNGVHPGERPVGCLPHLSASLSRFLDKMKSLFSSRGIATPGSKYYEEQKQSISHAHEQVKVIEMRAQPSPLSNKEIMDLGRKIERKFGQKLADMQEKAGTIGERIANTEAARTAYVIEAAEGYARGVRQYATDYLQTKLPSRWHGKNVDPQDKAAAIETVLAAGRFGEADLFKRFKEVIEKASLKASPSKVQPPQKRELTESAQQPQKRELTESDRVFLNEACSTPQARYDINACIEAMKPNIGDSFLDDIALDDFSYYEPLTSSRNKARVGEYVAKVCDRLTLFIASSCHAMIAMRSGGKEVIHEENVMTYARQWVDENLKPDVEKTIAETIGLALEDLRFRERTDRVYDRHFTPRL
jgi:hypothetical protein